MSVTPSGIEPDLPTCSTVPQPTAPPPISVSTVIVFIVMEGFVVLLADKSCVRHIYRIYLKDSFHRHNCNSYRTGTCHTTCSVLPVTYPHKAFQLLLSPSKQKPQKIFALRPYCCFTSHKTRT